MSCLAFPARFHWKEELARLSLLNHQHFVFTALWMYLTGVYAGALLLMNGTPDL